MTEPRWNPRHRDSPSLRRIRLAALILQAARQKVQHTDRYCALLDAYYRARREADEIGRAA